MSMKLSDLISLQGTLFAMMLIGAWLKKRGIMDENGKRYLTDLCVNIIIPCNIQPLSAPAEKGAAVLHHRSYERFSWKSHCGGSV